MDNLPETCLLGIMEVTCNDACFVECNYHDLLHADCTGATCQAKRPWRSDN